MRNKKRSENDSNIRDNFKKRIKTFSDESRTLMWESRLFQWIGDFLKHLTLIQIKKTLKAESKLFPTITEVAQQICSSPLVGTALQCSRVDWVEKIRLSSLEKLTKFNSLFVFFKFWANFHYKIVQEIERTVINFIRLSCYPSDYPSRPCGPDRR